MTLLARLRGAGILRRLAGFCGMLAIVVQLGVATAHDPSGLGSAPSWLGVALCHVGGGGSGPPSTPGDRPSTVCPLCLGLQASAAALVPPDVAPIAFAILPRSQPLPPSRDTGFGFAYPGGPAQPRAPPASV
ncbi:MAG TPA: DUF2946 family protein [Stellaceae bacterium]|nr:DUF2946 family protein [Stellaceae bacterium]